MRGTCSYIVRIYRRGFRSLVGLVEDPKSGEQWRFKNMEELWAVLGTRLRSPRSSPGASSGEPDEVEE